MIQKVVSRFVPILLLLVMSSYVSRYDYAFAERFETNIRIVALVQGIINIPFGLMLFIGGYSLNRRHLLYSISILIFAIIVTVISDKGLLLLIALISYLIRVFILNNSLAQNKDMNNIQLLLYYCTPILLYVFLIDFNFSINYFLVILVVVLLIYHPRTHTKSSLERPKVYAFNSLLGLVLTNIDLMLLSYMPSGLSLKVLYARRLSMFFEAFVQGLVQTSSYDNLVKWRKRITKPLFSLGLLFSIVSPKILEMWVGDFSFEWWVVLLMFLGLLKSISMLFERSVINDVVLLKKLNYLNFVIFLVSLALAKVYPIGIVVSMPLVISLARYWMYYEYNHTRG